MANNNREQSIPETSLEQAAAVNNLEEIVSTSNHKKTVVDTNNQLEVTLKLSNQKSLHIVHLDSQTVVINGKPFKKELVKLYLSNICNQQTSGKSKDSVTLSRNVKQEVRATISKATISRATISRTTISKRCSVSTPTSLVNGNVSVSQQTSGRIKNSATLARNIKQEFRATVSSNSVVSAPSLVNGNNSVNQPEVSLLRARLQAQKPSSSDTPSSSSKSTSTSESQPDESTDEENLFNGNHTNSEGIRFLQEQFRSSPTLQSILAELATLQKEYNDLEANSLDKEVDAMRKQNCLPSMIDLTGLFKKKTEILPVKTVTPVRAPVRPETIVKPSRISKPIPELVPVNSSKRVPASNDNENDDFGELVIDESDDEFTEDISCDSESVLTKPEPGKSPERWRKLHSAFKTQQKKIEILTKSHSTKTCNVAKTVRIDVLPMEPSPSVSPTPSSPIELRIDQVFSNGKEIVSCDRCNFEATEDEMVKHSLVHFKKVKESHENNVYRRSDVQFCGSTVKIKTEPDVVIILDDDDE